VKRTARPPPRTALTRTRPGQPDGTSAGSSSPGSQPSGPSAPAASPAAHRFHRAIEGVYEPGSTFKLLTAAAALDFGTVQLHSGFDASRPIRIGGHEINDFRGRNRWLALPEIIAYSSNLASAHMAMTVGPARHREFLARFGIARHTRLPVELPEADVQALAAAAEAAPLHLVVDLERCEITGLAHRRLRFEMDAGERDCLIAGLDAIDLTWRHRAAIEAFQARARAGEDVGASHIAPAVDPAEPAGGFTHQTLDRAGVGNVGSQGQRRTSGLLYQRDGFRRRRRVVRVVHHHARTLARAGKRHCPADPGAGTRDYHTPPAQAQWCIHGRAPSGRLASRAARRAIPSGSNPLITPEMRPAASTATPSSATVRMRSGVLMDSIV